MTDTLADFCAGVALDLLILARLHDRELDEADMAKLGQGGFSQLLTFRLRSERASQAMAMLSDAIAADDGDGCRHDELAADFAAIYLNHSIGASPNESVWLDEDGLAMQQPMFDVRERYARFGLTVPDWRKRADDHLVFQLQFVSLLVEEAQAATLSEAAAFLDDHTLRWLPDFANRVAARAGTPFYAALAALTACYIDELRDVLAEITKTPRPEPHARAPAAAQARETETSMAAPYVPGSAPSW